jgi:hypothetical protein
MKRRIRMRIRIKKRRENALHRSHSFSLQGASESIT